MGVHHSLGGSNTYTWLNCAGARKAIVAAIKAGLIPEESPGNIYSEKGTVAHGLGEICLDLNYEPSDFYNKTIPAVMGKKRTAKYLNAAELEFVDLDKEVMTAEYIEAVQVYVDYVRETRDKLKKAVLLLEESYSLEDYVNDDCGGSADASILEKLGLLEIIDYKNGQGVVEALSNPQTRLYGLGALRKHQKQYKFKEVKLTIVQPNIYHTDGKVRSETLTVTELAKWGRTVVKPAVKLLNSDNPELTPGEKQCMWCRVNGICKANADHSLAIAQKEFSDLDLPDDELPEVKTLTLEEATTIINNKPRIEKWLKAVQAYMETAVESGSVELPDHKLVERISNRQYKNEKSILRRLNRIHQGIDPYDKKVKSPAQMELLLKTEYGYKAKEAKALVDQFCERVKIGVTLAPINDGREAIAAPIKTEFKNEKGGEEEADNFYN